MNEKEYINYLERFIHHIMSCVYDINSSLNIINQNNIIDNTKIEYIYTLLSSIETNNIIYNLISDFYKKQYNKQIAMGFIASEVSSSHFIKFITNICEEKEDERTMLVGYILSNNLYEDDEEYFGKNNLKFCSSIEGYKEEILTYKEFYDYIKIACDIYIKFHPNEKEEVLNILEKIKIRYLAKE